MSSGFRNAAVAAHHAGAKKGGGGGKYTWGVGGLDDLKITSAALDHDDPNYISDDEQQQAIEPKSEKRHATAAKKARRRAADSLVALDPQDDFKAACVQIVDEFFEAEDVAEVARSLTELGHAVWNYEFVKQAVTRALDKTNRERELISYLLSSLYGSVLPAAAVQNGFRILLHRVDDLTLDQPQAPQLLGTFIARAIVDDLLPPAFARMNGESSAAKLCLARSVSLLDDGAHAAARLENCWNNESGTGGHMTVARIKQNFANLLREFVVSGDLREAERCVRDLAVPDFHFELVKQAATLAVDGDAQRVAMARLLAALYASQLVSQRALDVGLRIAIDNVADLALDVSPHAPRTLATFCTALVDAGCDECAALARDAPTLIDERISIAESRLAAFKAASSPVKASSSSSSSSSSSK